MMTRQELEGHWNQVKGSLREQWGDLTDNELDKAYGDLEQLVGVVQKKTGATRNEVENFVEDVISEHVANGDSSQSTSDQIRDYAGEVRENVKAYSDEASQFAHKQYARTAEQMQEGYEQVEDVVRKKPWESLAVTFGTGVIAGLIIGLTSSRRG